MTTGFSHDLLLLCAAGDRQVVQGLATKLGDAGPKAKVQTVAPHALAADLTAALEQAPLVLLAVSAPLQSTLAGLLAAESAEALEAGSWLVLQLDEGVIEGLPEAVEVIAWPRQGRGRGKLQREQALVRIQELAGPISTPLQSAAATPDPAQAEAADPANESSSRRDNFNKEVRNALKDRVGGFCSRPGCKSHTTGPHDNPDKVTDTGVAAHITAAAPGGPRYNAELTTAQRKAADNGMWLCQFCAKLIDSDPATYPEALLREWKAWAEQEQRDRQLGVTRGRSDWSWPGGAWDFGPYRKERRQGFVGREWLLQKVRSWAADPEAKQALLIGADFGVGKSAFLAKLLDQESEAEAQIEGEAENQMVGEKDAGPGLPVVAQHFCNSEENSYLSPGRFVQSLAAQLKEELPAYRKALENDGATSLRESLNRAEAEPLLAFQQALVAPLAKIPAPATRRLLVIDALDEALDHRPEAGGSSRYTIVDLLAKEARNLPGWLRVLATSRRRDEVLKPLREGFFSIEEINAEEDNNLADIHTYVEARCQQEPLAAILCRAGLSARETADVLQEKSGGKFLYAVRVLNDIASDALKLQNRQGLDALPPGMDGFYKTAFERRFPDEASYAAVQPVLALLCEQWEPLGGQTLGVILGRSARQVLTALQPLKDLLRLIPVETVEGSDQGDVFCSFDHLSLKQWLGEEIDYLPRAGRFGVDSDEAKQQIRTWALTEVEADRAHTSPYLVRHLASHLNEDERKEVIAWQLLQFPWLQARLRLAGIHALLSDFSSISLSADLISLQKSLRQAAHILIQKDIRNSSDQLASQILSRTSPGISKVLDDCLETARQKLRSESIPIPAYPSMGAHFLQTLTVIANTRCPLRRTSSGNLIFSTIRNQAVIWDAYSDKLIRQLTCHQNDISEIIELGKDETIFVTSSDDGSIKICHLERQVIVREDHHEPVLGLARLGFDIFASYSNHKILIWSYKNNVLTLRQEISSEANIEQIIAIRNDQFIIIDESKNPSLFTRAGSEFAKSDFLLPFTSLIYLPSIGALLGKSNIDNSYCSLKIGEIMESTPIPKLSDHLNGKTIHFLDSGNMDLVAVVDTSDLLVWKEADFDSDPIVISAKYTCTIAAIDEAQLAAMDKYGKIRILNTHEHLIHSSPALDSVISALEVIDNGNIVALDGSGSIALLKRLSSGIECRALRKEDTLNSSSDLTRIGECSIATTCNDRSIRIWTCTSNEVLDAGKLCFHQSDYTNSHRSPIFLIVLGTSCLIAADDNQIIGWPIDIRNNSIKFNGNPTGTILFNSENNRISSLFALVEAGSHAQHYLLALEKPKDDNHFLHTFSISLMHKSQARQIKFEHNPSFYPDFDPLRTSVSLKNGKLATAANNNNIYVWRVVNYNSCESINTLIGHTDNIRDMISIDDFRILSCSDDRTILMWTFSESEVNSRVVFVADGRITSLGFNDKHQFFVAGDEFGNVHILDL